MEQQSQLIIKLIFCKCTQVTAVFAADAVARLSGVVGVAAVTAGPGKRNNVFLILSCLSFEIQDILFQMKFRIICCVSD